MSKNWYPVIDHAVCIKCGACVEMCANGVYDKQKAPSPIIINSDGCIEGCHGCGSICPVGAITYFGENTEWAPQNSKKKTEGGCEGSCEGGCDCGGNC